MSTINVFKNSSAASVEINEITNLSYKNYRGEIFVNDENQKIVIRLDANTLENMIELFDMLRKYTPSTTEKEEMKQSLTSAVAYKVLELAKIKIQGKEKIPTCILRNTWLLDKDKMVKYMCLKFNGLECITDIKKRLTNKELMKEINHLKITIKELHKEIEELQY